MSKIINYKTNFTAGEVSADMFGRTDLSSYDNGAMVLKNIFINPIGGVERRCGLAYVDTIDDACRLIGFSFNTEQNYVIVLCSGKIKIYSNETLLQTLNAPYTTSSIGQVCWTQSADTLLLTHPDFAPYKLERDSDENFTLNVWSFDTNNEGQLLMPFEKFAASEITMQCQVLNVGAVGSLTCSANFFNAEHVGLRFRLQKGEVQVQSISSETVAQVKVMKALENSNSTTEWSEQAFSAVRGYPCTVTFYQGRLVIGGSRDLPNKLWFSKSFHIMNFDTGSGLDDEAINFLILSDQVNAIRGLMSGRHLQVFTSGSEWMVSGEPLTPQNIQLKRQTRIGSPIYKYVPPTDVSGATLFVSENGREVREFLFEDLEQAYQAKNVSLLSTHLIQNPVDMAYDNKRRLVYVLMEDGKMATLTNYRSESVLAWSRQETNGQFLSVCVLDDEAYFLIKRGIHTYLEVFDEECMTDCSLRGQVQTPSRVWNGLTHLIGYDVKIVSDDVVLPDERITSDSITLPYAASVVQIGLGFEHEISPLPPVATSSGGSCPLGAVRLIEARFRVIDTQSLIVDVGNGLTSAMTRQMRDGYTFDQSMTQESTDVSVHALGWVRNGLTPLWHIQSDLPQKCKIVSVYVTMKVSE